MVGRPCAVSREELYETFESFKENILELNSIVKPSAKIWMELHQNHFPNLSAKGIYSAAVRWKSAVIENIGDQEIDENVDESSDISIETNIADSTFNNTTISVSKTPRINFCVYLSDVVWKTIKPVPVRYNRKVDRYHKGTTRTYFVLEPRVWTTLIAERIAKHRKNIPCNWSFKTGKVYVSGKFYIVITAKCVNCSAKLLGFVKKKPEESDSVKFSFSVTNFNELLHEKNDEKEKTVRNVGAKADKIFTSSKSALALHQDLTRENTKMFEKTKGRTFSLNAIRCGKYRKRQQKKLSTCPSTALAYLKNAHSYVDTIYITPMNPFFVMYTSPDQIKLFKAYKMKNAYTRMACDASGGVAHKLVHVDGTLSEQILLYSLAISDEFQVSVHSMLSEIGYTNFISFWLSEWLRKGGSIPNEFVSDMALALLGGAAREFGQKANISDYINSLFDILNGKETVKKPSCFIRIDIAHFIKSVTRSKPLKNTRIKHRDFFIRSVALMIKMKTLSEARNHILAVLVVAMSTTEGYSDEAGCDTPCENYKQAIIRKIKGIDEESDESIRLINTEESSSLEENEDLETSNHDEFIEYMEGSQSNFSIWIEDIVKEAKRIVQQCDDGDRDNLMYNLPFASYFRKLCKMMLMWSAICCPIFESRYETSSSANVECDFKNVKLALNDIIPCSVDVFVQNHLDMIDGAVKRASQKYLKFVGGNDSESLDEDDSEYFVESDLEQSAETASFRPSRKIVVNDSPSKPSRKTVVLSHMECFNGEDLDYEDNTNKCSDQTVVDDHQKAVEVSIEPGCVACANKDFATGAHICLLCKKNVHILPGCSFPIEGDQEGYGETRICCSCKSKKYSNKMSSGSIKSLRRTKKTGSPTSSQQSKKNSAVTMSSLENKRSRKTEVNPRPNKRSRKTEVNPRPNKRSRKTEVNVRPNKQSRKTVVNDLPRNFDVEDSDDEDNTNKSSEQIVVNDHPKAVEVNIEPGCVACVNKDLATGAHICLLCEKNVHILPGCSILMEGDEEGHGETRICCSCYQKSKQCSEKVRSGSIKSLRRTQKTGSPKPSQQSNKNSAATMSSAKNKENIIHDEMNYKEQWNKKRKVKRSNYLRPSPYWDLITNVDKKIKLGFLFNGNLSKTIHHVNKVPVSVQNTCAFDSITQILAAAYAYFEHYRQICEESEDKIYQIVILLAKNSNLKKINNLRCALLYTTFNKNSCNIVVSQMIKEALKDTPSYSEVSKCPQCETTQRKKFPIISLAEQEFANDMKNLETAIDENFEKNRLCYHCKKRLKIDSKLSVVRTFEKHLFIEIPSSNGSKSSMFEESAVFKLNDSPLAITLSNKKYVLFGQIIFIPPLITNDIGHYIAAIRINNKWEIYDDLRSKPYMALAKESGVMVNESLFYIQLESNKSQCSTAEGLPTVSEHMSQPITNESTHLHDVPSNDSSIEVAMEHTDESLYELYHKKRPFAVRQFCNVGL